jgi:hypothetical protein
MQLSIFIGNPSRVLFVFTGSEFSFNPEGGLDGMEVNQSEFGVIDAFFEELPICFFPDAFLYRSVFNRKTDVFIKSVVLPALKMWFFPYTGGNLLRQVRAGVDGSSLPQHTGAG